MKLHAATTASDGQVSSMPTPSFFGVDINIMEAKNYSHLRGNHVFNCQAKQRKNSRSTLHVSVNVSVLLHVAKGSKRTSRSQNENNTILKKKKEKNAICEASRYVWLAHFLSKNSPCIPKDINNEWKLPQNKNGPRLMECSLMWGVATEISRRSIVQTHFLSMLQCLLQMAL